MLLADQLRSQHLDDAPHRSTLRRRLTVGNDDERATREGLNNTEVTPVERRHRVGAIAMGKNNERSVRQAERQISVSLHKGSCPDEVDSIERRKFIGSSGQFAKNRQFSIDARYTGSKVVEFCEYEWRDDQWLA